VPHPVDSHHHVDEHHQQTSSFAAFTSDRSSTASMLGSPATWRCSQHFSMFIQHLFKLHRDSSLQKKNSRIFQIYKSQIWATKRDQLLIEIWPLAPSGDAAWKVV
jgi:hypothetical protein